MPFCGPHGDFVSFQKWGASDDDHVSILHGENYKGELVLTACVSLTTLMDEKPSARWADWKVDPMWAQTSTTRARWIIFPVAPLSIVMQTGV